MAKTIIGIDPGKKGGIAIVLATGQVATQAMPSSQRDLFEIMEYWSMHSDAWCFVEKVGPTPRMGSAAAFKFGHSVGSITMACVAAGFRMEFVSPQRWQRELGLLSKGRGLAQDDTAKKNRNRARAQELFHGIEITNAIADALLIAEYGRRQLRSQDAA